MSERAGSGDGRDRCDARGTCRDTPDKPDAGGGGGGGRGGGGAARGAGRGGGRDPKPADARTKAPAA
ncbi:hypothetical protein GSH05_10965, partial [Burkholderia pseudomallei]|nr:hypothetical protein [Burkholderia pseudomallei]